jgi:hypothetical protein
VIRHGAVQPEAAEPAVGQVEVDLGAEPALGADAAEVADQEHADHQLRVDRGAPDRAVVGRHHAADEGRVQEGVDGAERVVARHVVLEPEGVEQRLRRHPPAHHRRLPRAAEVSESRPPGRANSDHKGFFNGIITRFPCGGRAALLFSGQNDGGPKAASRGRSEVAGRCDTNGLNS